MPNPVPLPGGEPDTLSQQSVPSLDWVLGTYGFYETIDFTTRRSPSPEQGAIVPIYMSHHQGMVMLSLVNCLKGQVMVHRFHADLRIQTVELLLWEAPILYPNTKARDEGLKRSDQGLTPPTYPESVLVDAELESKKKST